MEDVINKLGWKKAAAILVGLSIIGIIFSFISFSNSENQIQKDVVKTWKNQEGESKLSTGGNNNLPENQTTPAQHLKTYTTKYFQISYPDKYNGVPYTTSKGILANVKLEDPVLSRKIEIVVFDSSKNLTQLSRQFEVFQYAKSSIEINASLKGTMYKGNLSGGRISELVVFIPKNNATIRVMVTYQGKEDTNFEKEFERIVRTIN